MKMNKKCLCGLVIAALAFSMVFAGCKKSTGDDNSALLLMMMTAVPDGVYTTYNTGYGLSFTADGTTTNPDTITLTKDSIVSGNSASGTVKVAATLSYCATDSDAYAKYYYINQTSNSKHIGILKVEYTDSTMGTIDDMQADFGTTACALWVAYGKSYGLNIEDITNGNIKGYAYKGSN
jgi:hypothetical protein